MSEGNDEQVQREMEDLLAEKVCKFVSRIRPVFKDGTQFTFLVRFPDDRDSIIITDESSPDEMEQLIQSLRRFAPH